MAKLKVKTLTERAFNGFSAEGWTLAPSDHGGWEIRSGDNTLTWLNDADLLAINKLTGAAVRRIEKARQEAFIAKQGAEAGEA